MMTYLRHHLRWIEVWQMEILDLRWKMQTANLRDSDLNSKLTLFKERSQITAVEQNRLCFQGSLMFSFTPNYHSDLVSWMLRKKVN